MTTILFTGGGTLGSVTPLIAVANQLRRIQPSWRLTWIGTDDGPERRFIEPMMEFQSIPSVKFRRYWSIKTLRDFIRTPRVYLAAQRLVKNIHPNIMIGAGGYVSVPVGYAAKRVGARIMIHQPDVNPGLANRLLAPIVDQVTVTFTQTRPKFPASKTVVTGNPVRFELSQVDPIRARQKYSISRDRPLIVVIGGGTGAAGMNVLIEQTRLELDPKIVLFHLTGAHRGAADQTTNSYISRSTIWDGLEDLLAAATLVISRGGIGTLSELSLLSKPTIVIPIPHSHQVDNAKALEQQQAVLIQDQLKADPKKFATEIMELVSNESHRRALAQAIHAWNPPDAAFRIAQLVEHLVP